MKNVISEIIVCYKMDSFKIFFGKIMNLKDLFFFNDNEKEVIDKLLFFFWRN